MVLLSDIIVLMSFAHETWIVMPKKLWAWIAKILLVTPDLGVNY